jgi:hypothetical protein
MSFICFDFMAQVKISIYKFKNPDSKILNQFEICKIHKSLPSSLYSFVPKTKPVSV